MRTRIWAAGLATTAALALGGCAHTTAPPAPVDTSAMTAPVRRSVAITFYGVPDNDPPGAAITDDGQAGGAGTYADPITLATDHREIPAGTKVYVPYLHKYFVMEDSCAECTTDLTGHHKTHFDLWIGGKGVKASTVLAQENKLTPDGQTSVIINPPANKQVDPRPLLQY
jgi:hypothetical protein